MIYSTLLQRQLHRLLAGHPDPSSAALWPYLQSLSDQDGLNEPARQLLNAFPAFLHQIDESYQQHERKIELLRRSFEVNAAELNHANSTLKYQATQQQHVVHRLCKMARLLAQRVNVEFDPDDDEPLVAVVHLLQRLFQSHEDLSAALARSQERFQLAVENTQIGLWDWDFSSGDVYFSDEWAQLLGYAPNSIEASFDAWNRLIHPDDYARCGQVLRSNIKGETDLFDMEMRMRHASGQYRWMMTRGRVVRRKRNGIALRALGTMVDIDARKQTENELRQAKETAQHLQQAKSVALLKAGQQLQQLQALLLRSNSADDSDHLQEAVDVLSRVTADLLHVAQVESTEELHPPSHFNLHELIEQSANLLRNHAAQKSLGLHVEIWPTVARTVFGQAHHTQHVIHHLLHNAIQFAQNSQISLLVSHVPSAHLEQALVQFELRDHGAPIAAEGLYHPLNLQLLHADIDQSQHKALALSVILRRIEALKGSMVEVQSDSHGNVIRFRLPFSLAIHRAEMPPHDQQKNVLVVAENADSAAQICQIIAEFDQLCPIVAEDAQHALATLHAQYAQHQTIDLVLTAAQLSDSDGFSLSEHIRQQTWPQPAIVICGTLPSNLDQTGLALLGLNGYLQLPLEHTALASLLTQLQTAQACPAPLAVSEITSNNNSNSTQNTVASRVSPAPFLPQDSFECAPLQVLVVEDNTINQRLAVSFLNKAGHRVEVAVHGQQAIERFERQPFDLILMDIQMPVMGGVEATQIIRQLEQNGPRIPIIAMTAHNLPGDRERLMSYGMDGYISKPVRFEALKKEIYRVVHQPMQLVEHSPSSNAHADLARKAVRQNNYFDFDAALLLVDGRYEMLHELADLFVKNAPHRLIEIASALKQNDCSRLAFLAYQLKGETENFGYPRASVLAGNLADSANKQQHKQSEQVLTQLNSEVDRLIEDLQRRVLRSNDRMDF